MQFVLEAAVGSHPGRVRRSNEDNLYFAGKTLEETHTGLRHPVMRQFSLDEEQYFAVFDGMGGECSGERASYLAAYTMKKYLQEWKGYLLNPQTMCKRLCARMNDAVCENAGALLGHMGSTVAMLLFSGENAVACNLGDSRIYRLRASHLVQMTVDDNSSLRQGGGGKTPLIQYLGLPDSEVRLEPHIYGDKWRSGDQYLICSDGLTDMLNFAEVCAIMKEERGTSARVDRLTTLALERGGQDNLSMILCEIKAL